MIVKNEQKAFEEENEFDNAMNNLRLERNKDGIYSLKGKVSDGRKLIFIPKKSRLATLLIMKAHQDTCHWHLHKLGADFRLYMVGKL